MGFNSAFKGLKRGNGYLDSSVDSSDIGSNLTSGQFRLQCETVAIIGRR